MVQNGGGGGGVRRAGSASAGVDRVTLINVSPLTMQQKASVIILTRQKTRDFMARTVCGNDAVTWMPLQKDFVNE